MAENGTLYIVATPIGHLGDLSGRAISILNDVDYIAAEDTRHSQRLLNHYQINTPLFSLHAHNEQQRIDTVLTRLQRGDHIALISDAGTPLISDPGYPLVVACRQAHIDVVTIPGPCAAIAALSIAGLPCTRFSFEGFLPAKASARQTQLMSLVDDTRTLIFYVSPHRLLADLRDMINTFGGNRQAALARELTKQFETVLTGHLSDLEQGILSDLNQQRGEMVLIVAGADPKQATDDDELTRILAILLADCSLKQAVSLAVNITGHSKNKIYAMALALQKS